MGCIIFCFSYHIWEFTYTAGICGPDPSPPDQIIVLVHLVAATCRVSPGVPSSSTDCVVVTLIFLHLINTQVIGIIASVKKPRESRSSIRSIISNIRIRSHPVIIVDCVAIALRPTCKSCLGSFQNKMWKWIRSAATANNKFYKIYEMYIFLTRGNQRQRV